MHEIKGIFAGFSSAQLPHNHLFNHRLPTTQRIWGSESRRPQIAEVLFPGEFLVQKITALEISSDQTSHGFKWEIHLRHADGGYTVTPVISGENTNINRGAVGTFSLDNDPLKWPLKEGWEAKRTSEVPLDFILPTPQKAIAAQLRITNQHGWSRAIGLCFYGERIAELTAPLSDYIKDYQTDLRAFWLAK